MKQTAKQPTDQQHSSESKHTKGEWKVIPARYSEGDKLAFDIMAITSIKGMKSICSILPPGLCDNKYSGHLPNTNVPTPEAEANAMRIVTCVNGYDKILEDNRKLREALKELLNINRSATDILPLITAEHKAKSALRETE